MNTTPPRNSARSPQEVHEYALDFSHLRSFDVAGLPAESPVRLFVRHHGITVPISLELSDQGPTNAGTGLLILLKSPGDVEQDRQQPVLPPRSSWPVDKPHVLTVRHPSASGGEAFSPGPSQAGSREGAVPAIAEIVHVIAESLGHIPSARRVYVGSASDGQLARQLSSSDLGSRVAIDTGGPGRDTSEIREHPEDSVTPDLGQGPASADLAPEQRTEHSASLREHAPGSVERKYGSLEHFTAAMRSESFPLDLQVRLTIHRGESAPLDLMLVQRPGADRVTVLFNGAVDLERSGGDPVFQRSSWWRSIASHQIYVCDPGTVGEEALSLNWGQESLTEDAMPDIGSAVRTLCDSLGVTDSRRRTYFGSSAGGFLALMTAAQDDDPRVIINNAQFDWTRWMRGGVVALSTQKFGGRAPAALRRAMPYRTSALRRLAQRSSPLSIDYWVNTASPHDLKVDLPQAMSFIQDEGALAERFTINRYSDPVALHNPLGRDATLKLLSERSMPPVAVTHESGERPIESDPESGDHRIRYAPAASVAGYAYPVQGGSVYRPLARVRSDLGRQDVLLLAELIDDSGEHRPVPNWHWSPKKQRSFKYLAGRHPVRNGWVELPEISTETTDIGIILSVASWRSQVKDPRQLVEAIGLKDQSRTRTDVLTDTSFRELQ